MTDILDPGRDRSVDLRRTGLIWQRVKCESGGRATNASSGSSERSRSAPGVAGPIRALALVLAIGGCAGTQADGWEATPAGEACHQAYRVIDEAVARAGVRDAEAHRIPGFPFLRTNRFLASFADLAMSDHAYDAWIGRMADLDHDARTVELMNLSADRRHALDARLRATGRGWADAESALRGCPGSLQVAAHDRSGLTSAVRVPDDYSVLARSLGLYPLAAVPVALGFARWRRLNLPAFEVPVGEEAVGGRPTVFQPRAAGDGVAAEEVRRLLGRAAEADPLGIPDLGDSDLRRLAEAFAPTLLVDTRSAADRIGHPFWREDGLPGVDPARPVAFVRLEHGWFEGRPIAQLVYLFWFDARPPEGWIDLLAGRLDGLVWRVSLGHDGHPVMYDTIHACGCYHLFFPAPGVHLRPLPENDPADPRDPVLVPASAGWQAPAERALVRLAPDSHYVTGIGALGGQARPDAETVAYDLVIGDEVPDLALRSMPLPEGGRRSLYGPDGIVPGTERGERVLLWPMGILEPGAMRQWGRHPTAFVGRRHFDDPYLIDRAFTR